MAFNVSRTWDIVRAIFGVVVAGFAIAGAIIVGNFISSRGGSNTGGNGAGKGGAKEVKRRNSEAIKALDNAMLILRRARGRSDN